ncbi:MAG: hypothetical protein ACLFU9_04440 [Candidatus Bathyarchaeia archaeon]
MSNKMKTILSILLILSGVAIVLLATPIQAYVNEIGNNDLARTQDRHRARTRNCNSICDGTCTQFQNRQRMHESTRSGMRNGTMSLNQHEYRYKYQEQP